MSNTSHYEPQRAAPVPPVDNSTLSNSLFPPYYPERTSRLPQSSSSSAENRSGSQASNKTSSQTLTHPVEDEEGAGLKIKRKSLWQRCYNFLMVKLPRGWSIEYISSFISVAAFLSIVLVLYKFDQKSMPSWPLGISLNTLLAFLTAISQSCFVFPVVQGLSQMKWNWFTSRDRPLEDFESFDNASRGSWGSILLIFNTRGRLSVLLAAMIMVTSGVTSTITQAALSQDTRYVPGSGDAKIKRLLNDKYIDDSIVNDAMAPMMNAMYTATNTTYNYDTPFCSTGNCQWPTFGSLAVCSQINNITDKLSTVTLDQQCCWQNTTGHRWQAWDWGPEICQNCTTAGLSNGFYLNYNPTGSVLNTSNVWLSIEGEDMSAWSGVYSFSNDTFGYNALNAVQVIYLDTANETFYNSSLGLANSTILLQHSRAVEILFYLCAQTYDVSTANGTTVTTVNATLDYVTDVEKILLTSDDVHYSPATNYTFVLNGHNYSFYFIDYSLGTMLNSFTTGSFNYDVVSGGLSLTTPYGYAVGNILYHNDNINGDSSAGRDGQMFQDLSDMSSNMAKGLTNWLRSQGDTVQGRANSLSVYVIVRWDYLIFLGVQVILSATFLVWIVADSRRRKMGVLNKDSALATLLTISGADRETLERQLSMTEDGEEGMEEREDIVKNSRARLIRKDESGEWNLRLVKHQKS